MEFLIRLAGSSIYVHQHIDPFFGIARWRSLLDAVVQVASAQCVCLGGNLGPECQSAGKYDGLHRAIDTPVCSLVIYNPFTLVVEWRSYRNTWGRVDFSIAGLTPGWLGL